MFPANPTQDRLSLELSSPLDPNDIPRYYERLGKLFLFTNSVSLASHPLKTGALTVTGFERNYNLATYMLDQWPYFDILFHLTCFDLNKVNVRARLTLLKGLKIKRILLISGDGYQSSNKLSRLSFINSEELIRCIHLEYPNWFESLAIAGYPNDDESIEFNNLESIIAKARYGASAVYTQCLFDWLTFEGLEKSLKAHEETKHLDLVPSIALFDGSIKLVRILRVLQARIPKKLHYLEGLTDEQGTEGRNISREFIIDLIAGFQTRRPEKLINLCLFGLFDLALDIIENISQSSSLILDTDCIRDS